MFMCNLVENIYMFSQDKKVSLNDLDQCEDEMLLAFYIEGNQDAFDVLVMRYQSKLFAYLYRVTGNYEIAEDLVQETFIRVVDNIWKFDLDRTFSSWIYTIATNLARNEMRKKKRKVQEYTSDHIFSAISIKQPIDDAVYKETEEKFHKCLKDMNMRQRMVFVLRFHEKLSYEEIGNILGCKANTARTRMFYALEKLRDVLED